MEWKKAMWLLGWPCMRLTSPWSSHVGTTTFQPGSKSFSKRKQIWSLCTDFHVINAIHWCCLLWSWQSEVSWLFSVRFHKNTSPINIMWTSIGQNALHDIRTVKGYEPTALAAISIWLISFNNSLLWFFHHPFLKQDKMKHLMRNVGRLNYESGGPCHFYEVGPSSLLLIGAT